MHLPKELVKAQRANLNSASAAVRHTPPIAAAGSNTHLQASYHEPADAQNLKPTRRCWKGVWSPTTADKLQMLKDAA
mgnify:CR=1 FL=1